VRLAPFDAEFADGVHDKGGEHRGAVAAEEAVEGAAEAVVAEQGGLAGLKAEVLGDPTGGPLGEGV